VSEGFSEVLRRAAKGDATAADEFVRRFEEPVRTAIHVRLGPELRARIDTDDLFQSTMSVALSGLDKLDYRGERALLGWLLTIAERKVRMAARHHRADKRDVRRGVRIRTTYPIPGSLTGPLERTARGEEAERIRAAVGQLKKADREAIELRTFEGLSFPEMARRLRLSGEHAARQRFERALARLAKVLDA
jgi:RNA polymerase sigma factor (sigma-70 family)